MRQVIRKLRRYREARDGSVAVEFAMIGGVLVVMIMAILQIGMYFYISAAVSYATTKAARKIMTGAITSGTTTGAQFRTSTLCPLLPAGLSCANVITNVSVVQPGGSGFYQFVNAKQSGVIQPTMDNNKTTFCTGNPGSMVYVQVFYAMPVFIPVFKGLLATFQGQAAYFVGASSAFRNEPFQSSASGAC